MAGELNAGQLRLLRELLERRREELRATVAEELRRSEDPEALNLAREVHDQGEASVADLLMDQNIAGMERHVRELSEVEAALDRMREGRYGYCEDTGEPIAFERLRVQPTARRTVKAQELWERTHAQPGRPTL
ncbi:TraR/DksA family transcriptional regulator [Alkalilimnicola sp. S0819]|uniref:TraR/DksA family transcriptional regulator n=1 Tax=Alkalilimnicola sp. S0819 TaxID=2613922 RepID=UPI001261B01C|nr:TraR/DksA family transcriptional regulator [Alkalilimnicola sp. S0819]KAB7628183.1 TraR/DksA family transcriptional regulator [Alkalilimnicola sp. S0819]MPQ15071.1 TraR/DksA family transcriptional regulator [Alkalilimnicola sp. S0819]